MNPPRSAAIVALACAAIAAVYSGSISNGIAGDARGLILQDPRIQSSSPENLSNIFIHTYWWPYGESGLYRPVTTLTYLLNYSLSASQPAAYHATNLLLHVLNALLLFLVARRFTGQAEAGWIAAIWGVHPVLTESVAAISGRPDLLAAASTLGGLLIYWKSAETSGTKRLAWLATLGVVSLMGALSKESALVLPAIVALYALMWRDRRGLLGGMVAILLPIQIMLYLRAAALFPLPAVEFPFWDNPIAGAGFWTGRAAALAVMARECALLIWPARLSSDYSWAQVRPQDIAWLGVPAGLLAAAALVLLWRRSRTAFFVAASAIAAWLPSSNLLFPIGTIMAERFLYLPAMAFAAGVVWLILRLPARIAHAALAVVAVALAARSFQRISVWDSDLTLAEAAVLSAPDSYKSHKLLAATLLETNPSSPRVIDEAEKSVAILAPLPPRQNNADTWRRAALYYLQRSDPASLRRALELLERCRIVATAQALPAAIADTDRMIGEVHLRAGNPEAALAASERAAQSAPENPEAWRQYADALGTAGRTDDAIAALLEGILFTTDTGLRLRVVELYRRGAGGPCALLPGQNGAPAINPACPQVKAHLCAATAQAIKLRRQNNRSDLVTQLQTSGLRDFGCEAASLR